MSDPLRLERLARAGAPGTATFVVDRALRYVSAEGDALRAAGWTARDLVGKSVLDANGAMAAQMCEDYRAALAGSTFQREHGVGDHWFLTRGGPVIDESGAVVGAVATSVDITEKWRGEQLSRAQEQTLGDIAAGHPAEQCIETLGRITAGLRPGLRIAALIADAPRLTFERIISPQLGTAFTGALVGAPIGAEPVGTCGWAVHQGRVIDCLDVENDRFWSAAWRDLCLSLGIRAVRSFPVIDARGTAVASFMMAFDRPAPTDPFESTLAAFACHALRVLLERESVQRAATERAVEGARHFQRLADAGPAMIWTIDAAGMTTYASRAWYDYTGMQPGEALGVGWLDAVHPEDRDRVYELMSTQVRNGTGIRLEYRMRHRGDRQHRWVLADVRVHWNDQGTTDGYIGTVADIDDVRRAHELLSEEDRRKDEFLATLAHELRNPLAPLANGIALMQRAEPGSASAKRTLAMMERQFGQLTRLVDDLLDTSRIKSGRLQLRFERIELGAVVDLAVDAVRPKLDARGQRLSVEMVEGPVYLRGDPARLAQIFSNLLDNACKYTPEGGHLRVTVRVDGDEVCIEVADDGDGISPESQPGVFDIFDRAHQGRSHKTDGLGVGLYLVRSLVELHGGRVRLHSPGLGLGTTVSVRLPRQPTGAAPVVHHDPAVPPSPGAAGQVAGGSPKADGSGRPLQVLVVDDNADAADSLAMLLEPLGCQVSVARDGAAALAVAQNRSLDLAIFDIGMPEMDGYELARRFRAGARSSTATLVALTGWGQAGDRRRAQDAGFDLHWVKPVGWEAVAALLTALQRPSGDTAASS